MIGISTDLDLAPVLIDERLVRVIQKPCAVGVDIEILKALFQPTSRLRDMHSRLT